MEPNTPSANLVEMTADIAAAYVENNHLSVAELSALIAAVHTALSGLGKASVLEPAEPKLPAVSIKKSLGSDFIICLEDGQKFKSLKRHLRSKYDLSPDQYRAKWNLPSDYPMVAPTYAAARSRLAKQMGLGQVRKKSSALANKGRKPRVGE